MARVCYRMAPADLARALWERVLERADLLQNPEAGVDDKTRSLFDAITVLDPARGAALVESLADEPLASTGTLKNGARLGVARILTLEGEARWDDLLRRNLICGRLGSGISERAGSP